MNPIQRIDFLMPATSQYEVIHHFTHALFKAGVEAGYTTRLLYGEDRVEVPYKTPPDLTICFNGAPSLADGRWLSDVTNVPHISWLLDPPYRFWDKTRSEKIWIACDDQFGCRMLNNAHMERNLFLPHASDKDFLFPYSKSKKYEIVLLATYIDAEGRRKKWRERFGNFIFEGMEKAIFSFTNNLKPSFIEVLYENIRLNPKPLQEEEARQIFEEFELYIKGTERINLVRSLMPLKIDIFGGTIDEKTWENEFGDAKNVTLHGEVNFKEALEIMKNSKILLNTSIKNRAGAHERIFYGFSAGCLVATSENPYLKEILGDLPLYFDFTNKEGFKETLLEALKRPTDQQSRIEKAQKIIQKEHTWGNRLEKIVKTLQKVK